MDLIQEYKAFISKGNVVDLAVAVVIGGAFGKIISSFVAGAWVIETLPSSSIDETAISTMFIDNDDNLWLANSFDFFKIENGNTNNININLSPITSNDITKVYHRNADVFLLNDATISHYEANVGWSDIIVPLNSPISLYLMHRYG